MKKTFKQLSGLITIGIVILMGTIAYSMMPDNFNIRVTGNATFIQTENGVALSIPLEIMNNGLYDVEDLTLRVTLWNSTGYLMINSSSTPITIKHGTTFSGNIDLEINFTRWIQDHAYYNLFHSDTLNGNFSFKGRYAFSLFGIEVITPLSINWPAPMASAELLTTTITSYNSTHSLLRQDYRITNQMPMAYTAYFVLQVNKTNTIIGLDVFPTNLTASSTTNGHFDIYIPKPTSGDILDIIWMHAPPLNVVLDEKNYVVP